MAIDTEESATLAAFAGINTKTPLSEGTEKYTPNYIIRGTSQLLIQAAAYYDPNLKNTVLNFNTGQLSNGTEVGRAGKNKEIIP